MRRPTQLLPIATALLAVGAALAADGTIQRGRLDRGVIARPTADGVYVGWRLLDDDPATIGFNVYRRIGQAQPTRLNAETVRRTTDFVDTAADPATQRSYFVRPVVDGREGPPSREAVAASNQPAAAFIALDLDGNHTFQKVGIADLDGDRRLDFVVKQPNSNIDPYDKYYKPSPDTYKLEAYRHDGRLLWRYDLGWAIERGIWYSPYVVYDLDGDGRAEVAVKTGDGDPREPDGRVRDGAEYLTILDGATGRVRTQVDWPSREGFDGERGYNYASRNQLGVAYLDGRTPALVVERGTYNLIKLVAYRLRDDALGELWQWNNANEPRSYWGQGAHWMHAADVDADGRQEVVLGSAVVDDNGTALWSTGLGHPDHCYVGDVDPTHPGLEIYYGIEPRRPRGGMCLVEAATGKILWQHEEPTRHIHSSGLCADLIAEHPGWECYSGERDFADKRWLRSAAGRVLATDDLGGLAPRAVYWDADLQRELLVRGKIADYGHPPLPLHVEGHVAAVADILGDWREEIVTSVGGQLRIYTTTIPAADRRPCLLQDPIYRSDVICAAMGYFQVPSTSTCLSAETRQE